jgi:hypothetical protein
VTASPADLQSRTLIASPTSARSTCAHPNPNHGGWSCQVHVFGLLLGGVNLARRAISLPTDSEPKRTSDPKKRRSSAPMSGQGITQLGQHSKDHLLQNSDDPGERLVPHGGEEVGEPLVQHSGDQEVHND